MTLPPFLAAIPTPVLIGIPVLGLGVVLWYEFVFKKSAAATAPSGAPMGATYRPPTSSPSLTTMPSMVSRFHLSPADMINLGG